MIDYSVYMQPNPLDETAAPKAYAKAQMRENMSFTKFVNHIASHNGVFSRGTVKGVLSDACSCLVEQLLEGKKVQLGELGNFWISLASNGAETMETFSASNIKEVKIVFTPGEDFENLRGKADFNLVASRVAQAATLKTEKTGGTTVDLEAARAAARPSSGGTTGGGNTNSGNNSGSANSGNSGTADNSGSESNSGSTDSGTNGSTVTPSGDFTITAGVGADGGGSVSIKKNGVSVAGNSVQASASDTVVLEAVPENANYQFMSWSDGNSQNPRSIQPSADMNITASFLDLSKI